MVPEDLAQYGDLLAKINSDPVRRVLAISPNIAQYRLLKARFPGALIFCSSRRTWDLNERRLWRFDVIFAANVMHYSPDPHLWFGNVLACCDRFAVQDLINRKRATQYPFLGADADAIRYEFPACSVWSEHRNAFDLGTLDAEWELFSTYRVDRFHTHFVAIIRARKDVSRPGGREALSRWLALWGSTVFCRAKFLAVALVSPLRAAFGRRRQVLRVR